MVIRFFLKNNENKTKVSSINIIVLKYNPQIVK